MCATSTYHSAVISVENKKPRELSVFSFTRVYIEIVLLRSPQWNQWPVWERQYISSARIWSHRWCNQVFFIYYFGFLSHYFILEKCTSFAAFHAAVYSRYFFFFWTSLVYSTDSEPQHMTPLDKIWTFCWNGIIYLYPVCIKYLHILSYLVAGIWMSKQRFYDGFNVDNMILWETKFNIRNKIAIMKFNHIPRVSLIRSYHFNSIEPVLWRKKYLYSIKKTHTTATTTICLIIWSAGFGCHSRLSEI